MKKSSTRPNQRLPAIASGPKIFVPPIGKEMTFGASYFALLARAPVFCGTSQDKGCAALQESDFAVPCGIRVDLAAM
jgi:hypothetical protein